MRADPAKHRAVLELMYLCMALGFMGPFRQAPDGAERMERIREQTYALIAGARGRRAAAALGALAGCGRALPAAADPLPGLGRGF